MNTYFPPTKLPIDNKKFLYDVILEKESFIMVTMLIIFSIKCS